MQPRVESWHVALLDLANEDVLESAGAEDGGGGAVAVVGREPDLVHLRAEGVDRIGEDAYIVWQSKSSRVMVADKKLNISVFAIKLLRSTHLFSFFHS